MPSKKFWFGFCQLCISFSIGLYMQSISDKDLILTEHILDEGFRHKILNHPYIVLCFLGSLNLLLYYLSHKNDEKKQHEKLYNNICQIIFEEFISSANNFQNHDFRVSLFMAKDNFWGKRKILENVGRYQTRQEKKLCNVRFYPEQGSVGICYKYGIYHFGNICEYDAGNATPYYNDQLRVFKLPKAKAKKLINKSRSYISCPIKFFNSQDLFGVVVVDTDLSINFAQTNYRVIEEVLKHNSVIFNNPSI